MPEATRRPASRRFESLDHWRGVACLFVVIYHSTIVYLSTTSPASPAPGWIGGLLEMTHHLNVGVALFFVISGYCIAAAADSARRRNSGVGQYFVRRFRRIYPPFWIVVVLSIATFFILDYGWTAPLLSGPPWAQYRPWWYSPSQWLGNLTLSETWRHHLFGDPRAHFPGQAWTLCYEEQFYFVTGMLLLCARRRFFLGVAVVSIVTLAISEACRWNGVNVDGWFFDGAWLLFAAGVAVFYRIQYASRRSAWVLDGVLIGAVILSAVVTVPIYGAMIGFAFAAALPWLYRVDASVAASTLLRPVLLCGQMCYSLYLVHQIPVKAVSTALYRSGLTGATSTLLITIPASVAVSVALGWAFHVAVERRFLNAPAQQPPEPSLEAHSSALAEAFG
jgi:peptidoglycan/LPS O-acetylase OafA/YrhL